MDSSIFEKLAEARIREAIEKGELKDLPGEGKPLKLEEMLFVPPELRAFYRVMKNAGLVPQEVSIYKEIEDLQKRLTVSTETAEIDEIKDMIRDKSIQLSILMEKQRKRR